MYKLYLGLSTLYSLPGEATVITTLEGAGACELAQTFEYSVSSVSLVDAVDWKCCERVMFL